MLEKISLGTSIVHKMATAALHKPSYITVTSVSTTIASGSIPYMSTASASSIHLYITVRKTVMSVFISSPIESPSLATLTSHSFAQETVPETSLTQNSNGTSTSQSLVQDTVSIPPPTQLSAKKPHQNTIAIVAGALGRFIFVCELLAGFYFLRGYRLRHQNSTEITSGHPIIPEKDEGKDPVHEMAGKRKFGYPRPEVEWNSLSELEQGGSGRHQGPVQLSSSFHRINTSYWL